MGVSVYESTFAKLNGDGTQTITGVPFQPKAIIFWGASMTGTSFLDTMTVFYGFTDGTNDCMMGCASEDNVATSDGFAYHDTRYCIAPMHPNADGVVGAAELTSFNPDGFTLTWAGSDTSTGTIHYMAIGGTDITNVKVGIQTIGTAVIGNKAYTGVGFQPDFLLTANNGFVSASSILDLAATVDHAGLGTSAMARNAVDGFNEWAFSTASEGGRADSDTWRLQTNTKCFALLDNSTGTLTADADMVSMDSDGFTWNYTTTGANITNSKFIYLAIKGGVWDIGNHVVPATNITETTNTNASATLKGFMSFNIQTNLAGLGTIATHNTLAIGGSDGTRQSVTVYCDNDAAATMTSARIQNTINCVHMMFANATAASSTVTDVGTVQAFGNSSFAIAYTNSDTNVRTCQYFAVSEAPSGVPQAFGDTNIMLKRQSGGQGTIFG